MKGGNLIPPDLTHFFEHIFEKAKSRAFENASLNV